MYRGILIEESLMDWRLVNKLNITSVKVCKNPNDSEQLWHLYTVLVTDQDIKDISEYLKPAGYYTHFGSVNEGIVVFPQRIFRMNPNERVTWQEAINYGLKMGIPEKQMSFTFEGLME
jgi:hypothetical protein